MNELSVDRRPQKKRYSKATLPCLTCGRAFTNNSILQRHMRIHSDARPYTCETCGKTFKEVWYLRNHTRIHTNDWPFKCQHCDKSFREKSHLRLHAFTHSNDLATVCGTCGEAFINHDALEKHQSHTQCESFAQTQHLSQHERASSVDRSVDEMSTSQTRLRRQDNFLEVQLPDNGLSVQHEKVLLKNSFICQTCGLTFQQKISLYDHERMHLIERPFLCDECGKAFRKRDSLLKHLRIHENADLYECQVCGKRFTRRIGFLNHERSHKL